MHPPKWFNTVQFTASWAMGCCWLWDIEPHGKHLYIVRYKLHHVWPGALKHVAATL